VAVQAAKSVDSVQGEKSVELVQAAKSVDSVQGEKSVELAQGKAHEFLLSFFQRETKGRGKKCAYNPRHALLFF
jgi:hypothetical protein